MAGRIARVLGALCFFVILLSTFCWYSSEFHLRLDRIGTATVAVATRRLLLPVWTPSPIPHHLRLIAPANTFITAQAAMKAMKRMNPRCSFHQNRILTIARYAISIRAFPCKGLVTSIQVQESLVESLATAGSHQQQTIYQLHLALKQANACLSEPYFCSAAATEPAGLV